MKEESRQALFELLNTDVKTNVGRMPVTDYLEMRAGEYGYDSYAEMYEEGYRMAGYEKVSPKVIDEWHRQKEQGRLSLKEQLAREQGNAPLDSGNQKKLQAHKGLQEL